jgi:hypothetical protein
MVLGVGPTDRDTGLRAGRGAWVWFRRGGVLLPAMGHGGSSED